MIFSWKIDTYDGVILIMTYYIYRFTVQIVLWWNIIYDANFVKRYAEWQRHHFVE